MGKKTAIASATTGALIAIATFLYSHFIGFERPSLADKFPEDTWAYASVRHAGKAFLAFISNDELTAKSNIAKAIALIFEDPDYPKPALKHEIDPELLQSLRSFVKTQISIAALSPPTKGGQFPPIALATYFYGNPQRFEDTLHEIAEQASLEDVSFSWIQSAFGDEKYHTLQIEGDPGEELPPLSWSIVGDILYIASEPAAIERLLAHHQQAPAQNLATRIAKHKANKYVKNADISLYLNTKQSLAIANDALNSSLRELGALYASFSTDVFFREMGLSHFESFYAAQKLGGDQESFASITYNAYPKLLDTISSGNSSLHQRNPEFNILGSGSHNIHAGRLLQLIRDSIFNAAPLSRFAYIGLQGKVLSEIGTPLDSIIAHSFDGHIATLQTLDIGTSQTFAGDVIQQVVFDVAAKVRLTDKSAPLLKLIRARAEELTQSYPQKAYFDQNTFHFDSQSDKSLSAQRLAIKMQPDYLTIGYGTLKSFKTLSNREELYPFENDNESSSLKQIASGKLVLEGLPSTLFELSTILYQQINPGRPIPDEFLEFDWTSLSVLEQERDSSVFHDPEGRVYRVSKKRW